MTTAARIASPILTPTQCWALGWLVVGVVVLWGIFRAVTLGGASGNNTNLVGAQLAGNSVKMDVGGDLNIVISASKNLAGIVRNDFITTINNGATPQLPPGDPDMPGGKGPTPGAGGGKLRW